MPLGRGAVAWLLGYLPGTQHARLLGALQAGKACLSFLIAPGQAYQDMPSNSAARSLAQVGRRGLLCGQPVAMVLQRKGSRSKAPAFDPQSDKAVRTVRGAVSSVQVEECKRTRVLFDYTSIARSPENRDKMRPRYGLLKAIVEFAQGVPTRTQLARMLMGAGPWLFGARLVHCCLPASCCHTAKTTRLIGSLCVVSG